MNIVKMKEITSVQARISSGVFVQKSDYSQPTRYTSCCNFAIRKFTDWISGTSM